MRRCELQELNVSELVCMGKVDARNFGDWTLLTHKDSRSRRRRGGVRWPRGGGGVRECVSVYSTVCFVCVVCACLQMCVCA